jgi:hypothetical protein
VRKLKELVDILSETEIDYTKDIEIVVLKELRIVTSEISDSRNESHIRHSLADVIMITLLAILDNANEWLEIEVFARTKGK